MHAAAQRRCDTCAPSESTSSPAIRGRSASADELSSRSSQVPAAAARSDTPGEVEDIAEGAADSSGCATATTPGKLTRADKLKSMSGFNYFGGFSQRLMQA